MKIVVLSAFSLGSIFAHAINTIKMAEGFAKLGHQVTLICREGTADKKKVKDIYALTENFDIICLKSKLLRKNLDPNWHFALQASPYLIKIKPDFVYARNYIVPVVSSLLRFPTCAESHAAPTDKNPYLLSMIRGMKRHNFRAISTISPVLKQGFVEKGANEDKIIILSDAADLQLFSAPPLIPSPYDSEQINIVYSGHLYDYKGIPTILETAELLPSLQFHLVGGTDSDIERIKNIIQEKNINNIKLHGFIERKYLSAYLGNAAILLLPPSMKHPSASWTSPVKLCEYFSARVPVLASKIPALEYWLRNNEVYWFKPDSPEDMAQGIRFLLNNRLIANELVENAYTYALHNDYAHRAKRIIDFCFAQGQ